jgi:choline dehydrogenase-like flavoprotein
MFLDARTMDNKVHSCNICIIGAGAAGITLARALKHSRQQIFLLESGGFEPDAETQSLYTGDIIGLPYYPLDSARLRYFGGTTGHWGGACWPLEENEFRKRDWFPHSGWPLSRKDLDPYYVKAQETCEVGPFNYDPEYWSKEADRPMLPLENSRVITKIYQNSSPPTRFGTRYRKDIENADNITAILFANVTDIALDKVNETVSNVTVKTLSGNAFDVKSDIFVIAVGGLENPRLLLLNDIGNQNDLVGRFFMEHIGLPASTLLLRKSIDTDFYQRAPIDGTDIRAGLALKPEVLAKERILNSWSGLDMQRSPAIKIAYDWKAIKTPLLEGELPDGFTYYMKDILRSLRDLYADKWNSDEGNEWVTIPVHNHSEQAPNPLSRVTLGDEVDRLGQRKIRFDWRVTDLDRQSIRRAQEIIAAEVGKSNLGRAQILIPAKENIWEDPKRVSDVTYPSGSWHHMGTTRMHTDPRQGVVDENCRVHGTKNLYIAGSSVFPTCGFENPTLTIIAMVYRLADHLQSQT